MQWMVNAAGAITSIALVLGVGIWGYKLAVRDVSGIPVVRAMEGPMRVAPQEPGGEVAAHTGLSVNEVAAEGSAAQLPDQMVLAPRPIDLSAEDQPVEAAAIAPPAQTAATATLVSATPDQTVPQVDLIVPVAPVEQLTETPLTETPLAEAVANDIAQQIWRDREGFVYRSEALSESMAKAKALHAEPGDGPVLLLDHSDNVMSGGTCDTMDVLQAALKAHLTPIVVGPICDPQAVQRLWKIRANEVVSADIGNRIPLAQQGITKTPVRLTGLVRAKNDGEDVDVPVDFPPAIVTKYKSANEEYVPSAPIKEHEAKIVMAIVPLDVRFLLGCGLKWADNDIQSAPASDARRPPPAEGDDRTDRSRSASSAYDPLRFVD